MIRYYLFLDVTLLFSKTSLFYSPLKLSLIQLPASYVLPDGYATNPGTYTFTLTNSVGCDSLITVTSFLNQVLLSS